MLGYNPVRTVGRYRYAEQAHLVVFGKAVDLNGLTMCQGGRIPGQRVDPRGRVLAAGILPLAVLLKRTVVVFLQRLNEQHHVCSRLPGVHQHGLERHGCLINPGAQHPAPRVEFARAVTGRVVTPVIHEPELIDRYPIK